MKTLLLTACLCFLSTTPVGEESCVAQCALKYQQCLEKYEAWACRYSYKTCLKVCDRKHK